MSELIENYISDLALMVRVADSGGFSAAAKLTDIPQATISRRIAMLEERLNVRLFDRTTRAVALTEPGKRAYAHAKLMVQRGEAATTELDSMNLEPSGHLKIACPVVLGQAFIGDIAARFMEKYTSVEVKIYMTTREVNIIEEGFDIAFKIGPLKDSNLALTRLTPAKRGLYATRDYLTNSPAIEHPEDLERHRILKLSHSLGFANIALVREGHTKEIKLKVLMASNDVQPIKAAVSKGIGIGMLPRFSVTDEVAAGDLVEVLPDWKLPEVNVSALTPSHRGTLPCVRAFLNLTKQILRENS